VSAALAIILVAFSASVAFAEVSDVKGSKDHPMVSRYAGSIIIGARATLAASRRAGVRRLMRDSCLG